MLSLSGCIVADPPQYKEPLRTPPILDLNHAEPSPYWLVVVEKKPKHDLTVTVPLRSDDQGELLYFALHLNYKANRTFLVSSRLPPSTLDAGPRSIRLDVDLENVPSGCHQMTLIVAHDSSWDFLNQEPYLDAPQDDIAIATWWLNVAPMVNSDPYTLTDCPSPSEVQQ